MTKEKGWLLLFAVSPLVIGYAFNALMMNLGWYGMSMTAVTVLFAGYWIYGGSRIAKAGHTRRQALLWGNGFIVLDLCFIAFQLLVLGRFFSNGWGFASQIVFLPILRFSAIARSLLFFLTSSDMLGIFMVSCLIMVLLLNLGYSLGKRRR